MKRSAAESSLSAGWLRRSMLKKLLAAKYSELMVGT